MTRALDTGLTLKRGLFPLLATVLLLISFWGLGCAADEDPAAMTASTAVSPDPADDGPPALETTDAQAVLDGLLGWIHAEPTAAEYRFNAGYEHSAAYLWTYGEGGRPRRVERNENLHESLIPVPVVVDGENYFVEMGREGWVRMSPDIARRANEMQDVTESERTQAAFQIALTRYFDPLRILEHLRPGIAVDAGDNWYLAGTITSTDLIGTDLPNVVYQADDHGFFVPELRVTGFIRKSDHRPVAVWVQELRAGRGPSALVWSRAAAPPEPPPASTPYLGIEDGAYEDAELTLEQITERMLNDARGNLVLRGSGRDVRVSQGGVVLRIGETGEAPIVGVSGTTMFREGGHQAGGLFSQIYWPRDYRGEDDWVTIQLEDLEQAFKSSPSSEEIGLLLDARDRFLLVLLNDPYLVLSATRWEEEVESAPEDTSLNEGAKWRLSGAATVREVLGAGRDGEQVLAMLDASLAAAEEAGLGDTDPPVLGAEYELIVDVAADGRPVYWRRTLEPPLPEGDFTRWNLTEGEARFIGEAIEFGSLPEAAPIE